MATGAYSAVTFDTRGHDPEVLMALLGEWPFDSFHEEDGRVTGYVETAQLSAELREYLSQLPGVHCRGYTVDAVPDQNWNAQWEAAFPPVAVAEAFYIRAAFHPKPDTGRYRHEIVIAPRMAFGTGHHATTSMMLEALEPLAAGRIVLDFGCGTGILAVAAVQCGAAHVTGVDIQPEAIENSMEHAEMNQVRDRCTFRQGGKEVIGADRFGLILANINTWIIADAWRMLEAALEDGGYLLLSGILTRDEANIRQLVTNCPYTVLSTQSRDDWMQFTLRKHPGHRL